MNGELGVADHMVDTILFDLVGVLFFRKADVSQNRLVDEIDELVGQVTDDLVFKNRVLSDYRLSEVEFNKVLLAIFNKYTPYIPLWEMLPGLRQWYKLGIINNGTYLTYPYFENNYHIRQRFDLFVSSALEGVRKPDPSIYSRACERLGSELQNCLFMDDDEKNINGALQAGMQTIHWPDREQGFQEFTNFIRSTFPMAHSHD